MGVADFPIEIFKKAKTAGGNLTTLQKHCDLTDFKNIAKAQAASQNTSQPEVERPKENKGDSTPTSFTSVPGSPGPSHSATEAPSSKTSWESSTTQRSSTDLGSMDTSQTSVGTGSARGGSLKEALRGSINRARSLSRDRSKTRRDQSMTRRDSGNELHRSGTDSPFGKLRKDSEPPIFDPSKMTLENAGRASKGISRIVGAGLKSPMDFTLGLARGFHNAPKLYGDDTVRPQEKVTDFQSGLKAAGKVSNCHLMWHPA
jgi:hypothetical protein